MDYCSRTNYAVFSNLCPLQNDYIRRDPAMASNRNRLRHMLVTDSIFRIESMIVIKYFHTRAKAASVTDRNAAFRTNHQILIKINPASDLQLSTVINNNRSVSVADQMLTQGHLCVPIQAKAHSAVKQFHGTESQLATPKNTHQIQLYEVMQYQSIGFHSVAFLLIYPVSTHPAGVHSTVSNLRGDSLM